MLLFQNASVSDIKYTFCKYSVALHLAKWWMIVAVPAFDEVFHGVFLIWNVAFKMVFSFLEFFLGYFWPQNILTIAVLQMTQEGYLFLDVNLVARWRFWCLLLSNVVITEHCNHCWDCLYFVLISAKRTEIKIEFL